MSDANVWQPRKIIDISQEITSVGQRFIATEGQATFTITNFAYAINTDSLRVYRNGIWQDKDIGFIEISDTAFSVTPNCIEGDVISVSAVRDTLIGDISDAEQAVIDSAANAADAQNKAWEAEAEQMTADSWAVEPEDVAVKIYTSDGDGTFTATDTNPVEYSSLHHAAKSVTDLVTDASPQLGADLDLNGFDIPVSAAVQTAISSSATAVTGVIIDFAGATVPSGFLECDGSEISQATYADLYTAIGDTWAETAGVAAPGGTNFRLPPSSVDSLGLFSRGKGGAVVVGEYQEDVFKEHSHVVAINGVGYNAASGSITTARLIAGATGTVGDAAETRPRSITVLKCIKY